MVKLHQRSLIKKIITGIIISGFSGACIYQSFQATTLTIQAWAEFELNCIDQNLSGVTYNEDTDSLFMVTNEPVGLFQVSMQGDCLTSYPLNGFDDVEDIVYIGNNQYLLVEERLNKVNLIELKETSGEDSITVHHSFQIPKRNKPNKGLEGIAYDRINDEIFLVSEFPRRIYHIKDWQQNNSLLVDELRINPSLLTMGDYSSINVLQGKLLILSDRSSRFLKLDIHSDDQQRVNLVDRNGQKLKQAEGIAVNQQNLFVVSEPNHFYIYHLDTNSRELFGGVSNGGNFLL